VTVTSTPGNTAPDESVTRPLIRPVDTVWAKMVVETKIKSAVTLERKRSIAFSSHV
jgi:hypothetical protein